MKNVHSNNVISVRDEEDDDQSDDTLESDDDCIELDDNIDVNGHSNQSSNDVTEIHSDGEKNKQPKKKRKLETGMIVSK